MKILIQYIKPFKGLVFLAFLLAAINQTFSLFDPMIFGKLIDGFAKNPFLDPAGNERTQAMFLKGVGNMLLLLVGTAMVSRIAKAFQGFGDLSFGHRFLIERQVFPFLQSGRGIFDFQPLRRAQGLN